VPAGKTRVGDGEKVAAAVQIMDIFLVQGEFMSNIRTIFRGGRAEFLQGGEAPFCLKTDNAGGCMT